MSYMPDAWQENNIGCKTDLYAHKLNAGTKTEVCCLQFSISMGLGITVWQMIVACAVAYQSKVLLQRVVVHWERMST